MRSGMEPCLTSIGTGSSRRTAMTTSGLLPPTKPTKLWLKRLSFQSPRLFVALFHFGPDLRRAGLAADLVAGDERALA